MFSFTNTPNKLSDNQLSFLSKYPTLSEYYTTKGQLGTAPFDKLEKLNALSINIKDAIAEANKNMENMEDMSMVNELRQREALTSMPEGNDYVDDSDNKTDTESRSSSIDSMNTDNEMLPAQLTKLREDVKQQEMLLPQLTKLQEDVKQQIIFSSTMQQGSNSSTNETQNKNSWFNLWGGIKNKTAKRSKKGGRKTHKKRNNKKTTQKKGGRKMQKKSTNKKQ
jgi:hypothetical protein